MVTFWVVDGPNSICISSSHGPWLQNPLGQPYVPVGHAAHQRGRPALAPVVACSLPSDVKGTPTLDSLGGAEVSIVKDY